MISGGRKEAALLFLKECILGKHKCTIFSPFSAKVYTYIRFWGLQGGSVPLPIGKFCICKLNTQNFRPFFWFRFTEIYNFWWSQGAALLLIRECVFRGNHKCTNSVPFLSKCIRMWLQGATPPCLRKLFCKLNLQKYIISGGCEGAALLLIRECVFRGNHKCTISVPFLTHNFKPFVVYIFWWLQRAAGLLFIKECVFGETINAQFQSLFCQNLYIYTILVVARGQRPLA